jgi:hypothetical protein
MNRGSSWQVDGVRNDKIFLNLYFTKLPSPVNVVALDIRESDSLGLLSPN